MRRLLLLLAGALVLASCSSGDSEPETQPDSSGATTTSPSAEPTPSATPTTAPPLAWGPTQDEYDQAAAIVADMPVERQAGQVIVARYAGLEPPVGLVEELGLGGVILMGDNVESPEQVTDATAAIQRAGDRDYPVIIGIDQEGGTVARIKEPATEFPA